jgi:hypothetical protein
VVGERTTQAGSDSASLLPMVDDVNKTCGEWPDEVSADSGSFSVSNLIELEKKRHIEGYVSAAHLTGESNQRRSPLKSEGDCPEHCRLRARLRTSLIPTA